MQTELNNLPERLLQFLRKACNCTGKESFLLTVSGGVDSMVMLNLFRENVLNIAVAHCNFMLRGKESDGDEEFVRQTAHNAGIKFFSKQFETYAFSREKGISIQMAARELRYKWFDELALDQHYDRIATAHHRDDSIETFLINLSRGTGIAGLTGIRAVSGKLIRPMLFLSRQEIMSYAGSMKITWREDSSNISVRYLRNKIRHELLPRITKILPGFPETVVNTMEQLKDAKDVMDGVAGQFIRDAVRTSGERVEIDRDKIRQLSPARIILFTVLQPYGFNYETVVNLVETLDSQPGRQFLSRTHELTVDRSVLIIQPLRYVEEQETEVGEETAAIQFPLPLSFHYMQASEPYPIPRDSAIASLDRDLITYPLKIRRWKKGDYFYPLGMKGRKKLSDFFADAKIPLPDKKMVWILESAGNILWVIGLRIDNRYRVTLATRNILQITVCKGYDEI